MPFPVQTKVPSVFFLLPVSIPSKTPPPVWGFPEQSTDIPLSKGVLEAAAAVTNRFRRILHGQRGIASCLAFPGNLIRLYKGLQTQCGRQGKDQQHHDLLHQRQWRFTLHPVFLPCQTVLKPSRCSPRRNQLLSPSVCPFPAINQVRRFP